MQQETLLEASIFDALEASVNAAGGEKRVAAKLWPALGASSSEARLRYGLNPEHAQKLDLTEMLLFAKLAREADDNSFMAFLGRELSNEVKPIAPKVAKKRADLDRVEAVIGEALKAITKMREG